MDLPVQLEEPGPVPIRLSDIIQATRSHRAQSEGNAKFLTGPGGR